MELNGARALVVGASGALGSRIASALAAEGARVVGTTRDVGGSDGPDGAEALEQVVALDLVDLTGVRRAVDEAADALGGLDLVVVATGVAAFGAVESLDDVVAEEVLAVNLLGPMAVCSAALPHLADPACVVLVSAILVDMPMAGMAAYGASKAGLTGFAQALRKEVRRRHVAVLDVRPPHMETGLADRALSGEPPKLPPGHDVDDFVALVLQGVREDAAELVWDGSAKALALR